MAVTSSVGRWCRQVPGLLPAVRHGARVTVAASVGFYACRYGLSDRTTATYAIFGTIATGFLSQSGGPPAERAVTLLRLLPAAYALITVGTVLAAHAWAAALGMLLLGFTVTFAGVGGPRLVGLTNGLQLFYILPCFPPYEPATLPHRLAGVSVGLGLLAVAEVTLWPDPPPERYQDRLARAARALADCVAALGDAAEGRPGAVLRAERLLPLTAAAVEQLRFSRVPPMERPASAGRVDRSRGHTASALRYAASQTGRLAELSRGLEPLPTAAPLLHCTARALRAAAAAQDGTGPPPTTGELEQAMRVFAEVRARALRRLTPEDDRQRARRGSVALDVAVATRFALLATRIGRGAPVPPDEAPPEERPGPFWYAERSAAALWWSRLRCHLTPRSVAFQSAVRIALALAAARLAAAGLGVTHGFWVLLATLTLMRGSAADTRTTLRPALVGTFTGALAAGALLLVVGDHPAFYAAAMPPVMLLAFTAGPLLGPGWGQGLFTLVVSILFSQLAPAGWRLAEVRLVDVVVGALVGTVTGLCAWPRGGGGELRRAMGEFLRGAADAVQETVAVVGGRPHPGHVLPHARRVMILAEAGYAQYQTERADRRLAAVDWQAALVAGQFSVLGAEVVLGRSSPGCLAGAPVAVRRLEREAAEVAAAYRCAAAGLRLASPVPPAVLPALADDDPATRRTAGQESLHAADVRVWLTAVARNLARLEPPPPGGG
ncbi:FUSC family protein [Streptacidiphilus griseoplanus]|uniref:FUSC family protein n=1 Tax=Peterkaempfera griseoplana TaxID=66896 RepID=UPI0006E3C990|nr:FUSC family protein [Peterkaempfera griseoplana]